MAEITSWLPPPPPGEQGSFEACEQNCMSIQDTRNRFILWFPLFYSYTNDYDKYHIFLFSIDPDCDDTGYPHGPPQFKYGSQTCAEFNTAETYIDGSVTQLGWCDNYWYGGNIFYYTNLVGQRAKCRKTCSAYATPYCKSVICKGMTIMWKPKYCDNMVNHIKSCWLTVVIM